MFHSSSSFPPQITRGRFKRKWCLSVNHNDALLKTLPQELTKRVRTVEREGKGLRKERGIGESHTILYLFGVHNTLIACMHMTKFFSYHT